MPDTQGNDLVVSAQEDAYLRAAFRRFARPYWMLGLVLLATLAFWVGGREPPPAADAGRVGPPAPMLDELKAESLALRAQLAEVLERIHAVGEDLSGAARRVDELERRVERVSGRSATGRTDLAALTRRIDEADRRIQALESSPARVETRVDRPAAGAHPASAAGLPAGRNPTPP